MTELQEGVPWRLRLAREKAGIGRADAAKKAGVSISYLSLIERGKRRPSGPAMEVLARVYGVQRAWLETGAGDMFVIARTSLSGQEPRTWEAALEPFLIGSPLEGSLPQLAMGTGEARDRAWRELANDRKKEIQDVLRRFASIAVVIEKTLPQPIAEKMNDELAAHVVEYLDQAF